LQPLPACSGTRRENGPALRQIGVAHEPGSSPGWPAVLTAKSQPAVSPQAGLFGDEKAASRAPLKGLGAGDGVAVHPVLLLVTPGEQPKAQLALLRQLASTCRESSDPEALKHATSAADCVSFLDSLSREDTLVDRG
jgi:hypothetical protein